MHFTFLIYLFIFNYIHIFNISFNVFKIVHILYNIHLFIYINTYMYFTSSDSAPPSGKSGLILMTAADEGELGFSSGQSLFARPTHAEHVGTAPNIASSHSLLRTDTPSLSCSTKSSEILASGESRASFGSPLHSRYSPQLSLRSNFELSRSSEHSSYLERFGRMSDYYNDIIY